MYESYPYAEISGIHGPHVTVELLKPYPARICFYDFRLCVEVEVPPETVRILKAIANLRISRKESEELLKNPTLENVGRFLALKKIFSE
jgi:hypothetical protein